MDSLVVLVHSPLVGPFTWSLVSQRLQALGGFDVVVPTLTDSGVTPPPYWQQHAARVRQALTPIHQDHPLVLVGHSGAGPILPALAQTAHIPVAGYLFVDAGLPHPGQSHLDEMDASVPAFAQELRQELAKGSRFPEWTDEDLREDLPDGSIRRRVLAEMQPHPLSYFEEVLPDVPGWPDAPSGYIQFTEGYRPFLEQAERAGWPVRTFNAGHFHMLIDPAAVAEALVDLMQQMREGHL
jgi:pimeloyl-ACP methyl ester carboxylesterase